MNQELSFSRDTLLTFAVRILQLIFGVGTSILIARILGPEKKGIFSLAILLPSMVFIVGNLGFPQSAVFFIGRRRFDPPRVTGNTLALALYLSIAGCVIAFAIVKLGGDSIFKGVPEDVLLKSFALIPLQYVFVFSGHILLGLKRIMRYNLTSSIQIISYFLFVLIALIVIAGGVTETLFAFTASYLLAILFLAVTLRREIGPMHLRIDGGYLREATRFGVQTYAGNIVQFLHYRIDLFLLNLFLNPASVGYYSVSVALAEKLWLVSDSAGTVLFPYISSHRSDEERSSLTPVVCRSVLLFTLLGSLLLFGLARPLVTLLFSSVYAQSVGSLQILILGVLSASIWKLLANDLYGRGRPELNVAVSVFSLGMNVALNILFIPRFGIRGAAWATSVTYSVALFVLLGIYMRVTGTGAADLFLLRKSDFALYRRILRNLLVRKPGGKE